MKKIDKRKISMLALMIIFLCNMFIFFEGIVLAKDEKTSVQWENTTPDRQISPTGSLNIEDGNIDWGSSTFEEAAEAAQTPDAEDTTDERGVQEALLLSMTGILGMMGITKLADMREKVNQQIPTGNGLWIPEKDRTQIISLINKIASKKYYIDKQGYLQAVSGAPEDSSKSKTYSQILDKLISTDKKTVVGMDTKNESGQGIGGITVGDNRTNQAVILDPNTNGENGQEYVLAHELTHALRGSCGLKEKDLDGGINEDEEAHTIAVENAIRWETGYVLRNDGSVRDDVNGDGIADGDGSYGEYNDPANGNDPGKLLINNESSLSGSIYSYYNTKVRNYLINMGISSSGIGWNGKYVTIYNKSLKISGMTNRNGTTYADSRKIEEAVKKVTDESVRDYLRKLDIPSSAINYSGGKVTVYGKKLYISKTANIGGRIYTTSTTNIRNAVTSSFTDVERYLKKNLNEYYRKKFIFSGNGVKIDGKYYTIGQTIKVNGKLYTASTANLKNILKQYANSPQPKGTNVKTYLTNVLGIPNSQIGWRHNRVTIYGKTLSISNLTNSNGATYADNRNINTAVKKVLTSVDDYLKRSLKIPSSAIGFSKGKVTVYGQSLSISQTANIEGQLYTTSTTNIKNAFAKLKVEDYLAKKKKSNPSFSYTISGNKVKVDGKTFTIGQSFVISRKLYTATTNNIDNAKASDGTKLSDYFNPPTATINKKSIGNVGKYSTGYISKTANIYGNAYDIVSALKGTQVSTNKYTIWNAKENRTYTIDYNSIKRKKEGVPQKITVRYVDGKGKTGTKTTYGVVKNGKILGDVKFLSQLLGTAKITEKVNSIAVNATGSGTKPVIGGGTGKKEYISPIKKGTITSPYGERIHPTKKNS